MKSFKTADWFDIKSLGLIAAVELGDNELVSAGETVQIGGELYRVRSIEHYPIVGTKGKRTHAGYVLDGKMGLVVEKV